MVFGKKVILSLLSILVFFLVRASAQFEGCPEISDSEALSRLVSDALSGGLYYAYLPFSVTVRRNHTVCLSVGPRAGTVSSVSMLVEYECSPPQHELCESGNSTLVIRQFDFGCTFIDNEYRWTSRQFGSSDSRVPTAKFNTMPRTDCSVCLERTIAESLGLLHLLSFEPVTRCIACSDGCAVAGIQRCFGVGNTMCCNYYVNGTCVKVCPPTTQPDSNYNCQRVVVGFEERVYIVEESHSLLELPVMVKEGPLTQRVTLLVSLDRKNTTVGDDYEIKNYIVQLKPGLHPPLGRVMVEILEDDVIEGDEEFVLSLELKTGSSAAIDIPSAVIIIMEKDEPTTENDTKPITSTPAAIENGCPSETDELWGLYWPTAAQETIAHTICGQDTKGMATRRCMAGAVWKPANVSLCENTYISYIGILARELFSRPNLKLEEALLLVEELANATRSAGGDKAHLPQDIITASEIVAKMVDLLLVVTTGNATSPPQEIDINKTVVLVDVMSLLLREENQVGFASLRDSGSTTDSRNLLNSAEGYSQYVGRVLVNDTLNPEHLLYSQDNIVLVSQRRSQEDLELGNGGADVTFPQENEVNYAVNEQGLPAVVSVPGQLLSNNYIGNVSVTSLFFQDLHHLLPVNTSNGTAPRSFVISSEIQGVAVDPLNPLIFEDTPITLTFRVKLSDENEVPKCVYWDFTNGISESGWSTDGVKTKSVRRDGDIATITCTSSHLTSFAVLVDVGGAKITSKPLQIVSYIGISISISCLFLTIIFFASLGKKLATMVHNFVHLNLAISLFLAYVIFAVGIEVATRNQSACRAVAALIQYFLLAAFCWMMCEGIMLYLMLVVVFSQVSQKWWFFLLLGWGLPLIFVIIGVSSVLDEYGVRDEETGKLLYCWLSSGNGKHAIWTFAAPMLGIITVNTVFLVLVLRSIFVSKSSQDHKNSSKFQKRQELAKYMVKASVILLPLLGLTWVFGLFAVNENTAVFAWLFTIFNSLQGVSIFVFHVFRNERVWGRFRKSVMDPDGILRSFSSRSGRTTASRISHSGFSSRPCDGDMEMKPNRRGLVRETNILASYPVVVNTNDAFEPREDTPTSSTHNEEKEEDGKPKCGLIATGDALSSSGDSSCSTSPTVRNVLTHGETPNSDSDAQATSTKAQQQNSIVVGNSDSDAQATSTKAQQQNSIVVGNSDSDAQATSTKTQQQNSIVVDNVNLYKNLCEDIASVVNVVARKMSNSA